MSQEALFLCFWLQCPQSLVPQVHSCQRLGAAENPSPSLSLAAVTARLMLEGLAVTVLWTSPPLSRQAAAPSRRCPALPQQLVTLFAEMDCLTAAESSSQLQRGPCTPPLKLWNRELRCVLGVSLDDFSAICKAMYICKMGGVENSLLQPELASQLIAVLKLHAYGGLT